MPRVTNKAAGSRIFFAKDKNGVLEAVTLAPGETREDVTLADENNVVFQAWVDNGEVALDISDKDLEKFHADRAAAAVSVAGVLPGVTQPHPVAQQNIQARTDTPGPVDARLAPQNAPVHPIILATPPADESKPQPQPAPVPQKAPEPPAKG